MSFRISRLPFCSALCPPWLPAIDCIKARPCPSGTDCIQLKRGSRRPAGEERTLLRHPFPQHLLSGTQINYLQPSLQVSAPGRWSAPVATFSTPGQQLPALALLVIITAEVPHHLLKSCPQGCPFIKLSPNDFLFRVSLTLAEATDDTGSSDQV